MRDLIVVESTAQYYSAVRFAAEVAAGKTEHVVYVYRRLAVGSDSRRLLIARIPAGTIHPGKYRVESIGRRGVSLERQPDEGLRFDPQGWRWRKSCPWYGIGWRWWWPDKRGGCGIYLARLYRQIVPRVAGIDPDLLEPLAGAYWSVGHDGDPSHPMDFRRPGYRAVIMPMVST